MNNIEDPGTRAKAQLASQGPASYSYGVAPDEEGDLAHGGADQVRAHPGLFLLSAAQNTCAEFPAAALADGVGGMACHWFGCCPRPWGSEQVDFIDPATLQRSFENAERLWRVSTTQFAGSTVAERLELFLGGLFDRGRPTDRLVQAMPLALDPALPGTGQCGGSVLLGPLLSGAAPGFELRPRALCRRLLRKGSRVWGAELVDLAHGTQSTVGARAVVVAADALRTPQLLFASDIRPPALGRYLNEHPFLSLTVEVEASSPLAQPDERSKPAEGGTHLNDVMPSSGVTWVPFAEDEFPFHAQVAQRGRKLSFAFFVSQDVVRSNRLGFSSSDSDWRGLPALQIRYGLTGADLARVRRARDLMIDLAAQLTGRRTSPRLMPSGSSLHYQGTVRMGAADDGTTVCDQYGRVWGADNLVVAGNGLIPTATACNPTLTTTALALHGAGALAGRLSNTV